MGASTVYVSTYDGTAEGGTTEEPGDYIAISTPQEVNFAQGQTTADVYVDISSDTVTDDNETFSLLLFKSKKDIEANEYHSSSEAVINDTTSTAPQYYKITSKSDSTITEGDAVTFTIKRYSSSNKTDENP